MSIYIYIYVCVCIYVSRSHPNVAGVRLTWWIKPGGVYVAAMEEYTTDYTLNPEIILSVSTLKAIVPWRKLYVLYTD